MFSRAKGQLLRVAAVATILNNHLGEEEDDEMDDANVDPDVIDCVDELVGAVHEQLEQFRPIYIPKRSIEIAYQLIKMSLNQLCKRIFFKKVTTRFFARNTNSQAPSFSVNSSLKCFLYVS